MAKIKAMACIADAVQRFDLFASRITTLLSSSAAKMLWLEGGKADNASTISNLNFKRSILIFGGILFDIASCLHRNQEFATAKSMVTISSAENHDTAAYVMADLPPCLAIERRQSRSYTCFNKFHYKSADFESVSREVATMVSIPSVCGSAVVVTLSMWKVVLQKNKVLDAEYVTWKYDPARPNGQNMCPGVVQMR
ncbi:hypothetical protein TNCV_472681 [Trichonephila clavipes]|nr:hypothetical protein TNCV_472681 [Trichonephila clavipes]